MGAYVRVSGLTLTLGLVAATVVAGCTTTLSSRPLVHAPAFEGAPLEVSDREALPFCGSESVTYEATGYNVDGRLCFWASFESNEAAEFVSRQPTAEGDAVIEIFRIRPNRAPEICANAASLTYSTERLGTYVLPG